MKLMRVVVAIGVIGIAGAFVLPAGNASAVINESIKFLGQEFQFAVSPVMTEFELKPGATTGDRYRVRNVGSQEIDLKIGLAAMNFSDQTEFYGVPRNEILNWTTITLDKCTPTKVAQGVIFVHMRVKEECFVDFKTKTPLDAPFGEQYMSLYFQEYIDSEEEGMQMVRSIGTNIFGTNRTGSSAGDACAKVTGQRIPFWLFDGPLDTTVTVENCGRLNFHTGVKVEVHNLFGALVYEDAEFVDNMVAAESKRIVKRGWAEASMGIYKVKQTVETLGETYVVEKWTFIIPIWLIIVILLCIAIIVYTIIHDRKKKRMKRAGGK